MRALRHCKDCRYEWEPHAPAWVLGLGILFGVALLALAVGTFTMRTSLGSAMLGFMGTAIIRTFVLRWKALRAGQVLDGQENPQLAPAAGEATQSPGANIGRVIGVAICTLVGLISLSHPSERPYAVVFLLVIWGTVLVSWLLMRRK